MSQGTSPNAASEESPSLTTGLEALQSSPAFRGPVEPVADHDHVHTNDHFASIYESREEQFAAAMPFIRQGIERGERCLYITYENSRERVLEAMRDYDIDVEAALDSGQLSIHDEQETYLRNESFDADETVAFIEAAIEDAKEEYNALRMTGEMSSVLQEDPECRELIRCEAKANYLFDEVDGLALCQYNRNEFPPEVIRDVINTHPLLVHEGRVSHNVYYTPPTEFFGEDKADREVDRLLGSLREQTDAKAELQRRERYLRATYEVTSDPDRTFAEKLEALFDLGCERFDLEFGFLNRVDPDADRLEIEYASDDHEQYQVGAELPLSETYCRDTVDVEAAVCISDPAEDGFGDCLVYEDFGVGAYLGTYIPVDGDHDRTLAFVPAAESRSESVSISEEDRTYLELLGQWIGSELERRQRERVLAERTEHLNALVETTPECIKTVAADGTLLQMNPAGLEMVEAPDESAVVDENVYDLIAPEHRDRFREFNERVCSGERATLEFDIVGLEGTRRHMESHAAPLERPDGSTVQVALTRDVTEQVERERELRRTKNRFETVFERSNDAMLLFEQDADEFVEVNSTAVELLGYDREELLSRGPSDLHPHEPEQARAFLDTVSEEGHGWTEELSWRTKDGTAIPVEISVSSFELEDRSMMLAVGRDVRERKQHERYQRELQEIIADPQASFDEKIGDLLEMGRDRFDLEIGYFNRVRDDVVEIVETIGPHELLEPGATDPVSETYCGQVLSSSGTLAVSDASDADWATEDVPYERFGFEAFFGTTVRVGSDEYGTLCFASASPRREPFTDAERTFLDLMGQMASYELARQRRERFLRESHRITSDPDRDFEAKLEDLLTLGSEWMGLDAAGLTHLPSSEDAFRNEYTIGYGTDAAEGAEELWTDPGEGCYCRQAIESDEPVGMADVRGTDWEDDEIHQEHGLTCYLGTKVTNGSTPYGTVWVGSTEPREREFTETERTFLELIGQWVSYEIERDHREQALKASNERLEQFAYAASHDLQEPLRMVSSYLQLLDRQYGDAFDEDGREFLEYAVDGADRMREMIDGLLKYSRVETRGDPFEPVALDALVDDVLEDLQLQIEESDAEVTVDDLPRVEGDANQLRQLFQNLLENAITYSGESPPRVDIDARRRKQEWVISVADDGIGIEPDDQERIFDVFDRLHSRDEYDGTGLGLALCERIVERHDGEIWVESEPGAGSVFSFTLPTSGSVDG